MSIPTNIIAGKLVVSGMPENACFTNFKDLLNSLPEFLSVEVPGSVTNVIVSNIQPSSSQTTNVWFRLSNSGSFLGIYIFSQGEWHNIYPINDGTKVQIETFYAEDGVPPEGWRQIKVGDPLLPAAVVTAITSRDVNHPTNAYQILFSAYFISF